MTDWLPTLYSLAGGDIHDLRSVDGYDMWDTLSQATESPRKEILHNIDPKSGEAALRFNNWKLLVNTSKRSKRPSRFECSRKKKQCSVQFLFVFVYLVF